MVFNSLDRIDAHELWDRAGPKTEGYTSPEDMITDIMDVGRQVFVSPQEREELKLELEESGVIRGREYQVYRKDGSTFWVSVNARAVRDDSGTLSYYEGFIQDITERKRGKA